MMNNINKSIVIIATLSACASLFSCGMHKSHIDDVSEVRSLTGIGYTGKKYYFGWGMNDNGNGEMDNEVKYDVKHTNDIFTKNIGGDYLGTTLIGQEAVNGSAIKSEWRTLASQMSAN